MRDFPGVEKHRLYLLQPQPYRAQMGAGWSIDGVLTGKAAPLRGSEASAIGKARRTGPVRVTFTGLGGDEQADRVNHGGIDMAVHHYPRDHYAHWQGLFSHPLLDDAGALGENISTSGLLEGDACIGDRFRLGTALVEISQGRKPCWKPAHRLGYPSLVAEIVTSARSGWYFRVIEEGIVEEGAVLELIERPYPQWTVARVFGLIVRGDIDKAAMRALGDLPVLSAVWRTRAAKVAAN